MLSGLGALLMPVSIGPGLLRRWRSSPARRQGFRAYSHAARLFNARKLGDLAASCGVAVLAALALMAQAMAAPPRILAFGDSLVAGYGVAPEDAFPVRLQARLASDGHAAQVINGGVSGDTSAGGLARLDWALADKPDMVLVEFGANDALRGTDPKVTAANLDRILARISASGAKILLIGMLAPTNWGRQYQDEFAALYPALAAKYHVPLYPFFLDGVAMDATLNQADGLHPNPRGVAVIVDRIAPYVERLLSGAASSDAAGGKG